MAMANCQGDDASSDTKEQHAYHDTSACITSLRGAEQRQQDKPIERWCWNLKPREMRSRTTRDLLKASSLRQRASRTRNPVICLKKHNEPMQVDEFGTLYFTHQKMPKTTSHHFTVENQTKRPTSFASALVATTLLDNHSRCQVTEFTQFTLIKQLQSLCNPRTTKIYCRLLAMSNQAQSLSNIKHKLHVTNYLILSVPHKELSTNYTQCFYSIHKVYLKLANRRTFRR